MFGYAVNETPRADAGADQLAQRMTQPARDSSQERRTALAASRWQGAGHPRVRERQARARRYGGRQHATRARHRHGGAARRRSSTRVIVPVLAGESVRPEENHDPHQSDRTLRGRRPAWRRRPHRPQDHRRHLRRRGTSRRRRVQRQGLQQSRSLRRVCSALGSEERRCGGPGATAARLRSPTRSAWPIRSPCMSTRSAPANCRMNRLRKRCTKFSISVRARSSRRSGCAIRSIGRPRRMAISAAGLSGSVDGRELVLCLGTR